MGLVGTEEIMSIRLQVCDAKNIFMALELDHLSDLYVLNGSNVNNTLLVAITLNQAFC